MARAQYTPEADGDLVRISAYIAEDSPVSAVRWLDAMQKVCEVLASQPGIGQRVLTSRLGEVRRHVAGSYLVYYRPAAVGIEILRVIHGARDQNRLI